MTEPPSSDRSVRDELQIAVRDLWSQATDSGDDYIVFTDRRHLQTRVRRENDELYSVEWEPDEAEDGAWLVLGRRFENPREACLHAYQGPHP